jgi:hypothetical protein
MTTPEETARRAERERVAMAATPILGAPIEHLRVSWGGVWSGFVIGLSASILLGMLGLAIGITAADVGPGDAGAAAKGLGIGAGVWAFLTLIISLFVGGMVAARSGAALDRPTAAIHGALVWGLAVIATIYLGAAGIGLGASALFNVAGSAASQAGGGGVIADLTSGDANRMAARLADPRTASTVASATGMPQADVERILADARTRIQASQNDPARAVSEARDALQPIIARAQQQVAATAAQAKPYATGATWAGFGALLVSLAAALGGAMLGCRQVREEAIAPAM